jgi:hypothetical protein
LRPRRLRDVLSVDQSLIHPFILFIVKHWAVRFRAKCALVFDDVGQICGIRSTHIEDEYAAVLLKRISTFFTDLNSDVCQRPIFFVTAESIFDLTRRAPHSARPPPSPITSSPRPGPSPPIWLWN